MNIKSVSVWWLKYFLSNSEATFVAQFIKKSSNTEAEKSVAYIKKRAHQWQILKNNKDILNICLFGQTMR